MEIIIHRINTIKDLKILNNKFGIEIDVRSKNSKLILNHEPFICGDYLEDYLEVYSHGTIVFNIKEAGIEEEVLSLVKKYKLSSFFLLDVEMSYLYKASKDNQKNIAVRFSEFEPIELTKNFINLVDWVWIDTVTTLPILENNLHILSFFKSCIVSPDRWGRKNDIKKYIEKIKRLKFKPNAIMTSYECKDLWL